MLYQSELDFFEKVILDDAPIVLAINLRDAPCAKYMKTDTREYYELSSYQHTIPYNYKEILNDKGKNLLEECQSKYNRGEYKDVFENYILVFNNSGSWYPDKDNKFYNDESLGMLNSWNDVSVSGTWKSNGEKVITTPVFLLTSEWCLTSNNSLYKLENKIIV